MELSLTMSQDHVDNLEPTTPLILAEGTSVRDAVKAMQSQSKGAVMICRDGRLVGIFTERDLLKKILYQKASLDTPLENVMNTEPRVVRDDASTLDALRIFRRGGFRHLPIVDGENRPTGMLSIKSMVHYLADLYPEVIFNLPPEPGRISSVIDAG